MERYLDLDVHAASCTLAVISQTGKRLKDFPIETHGQALVEAIRMIPGQEHLVFEEGLQSAWLYETLRPHVDEIVVAGITESRRPKSDKRDAYVFVIKSVRRHCSPIRMLGSRSLRRLPPDIGG